MKPIRLFSMLAGALLLVGFALTQSVRAYDICSDDCTADAQQFFDDCMRFNNAPEYCATGQCQAFNLCMDDNLCNGEKQICF